MFSGFSSPGILFGASVPQSGSYGELSCRRHLPLVISHCKSICALLSICLRLENECTSSQNQAHVYDNQTEQGPVRCMGHNLNFRGSVLAGELFLRLTFLIPHAILDPKPWVGLIRFHAIVIKDMLRGPVSHPAQPCVMHLVCKGCTCLRH